MKEPSEAALRRWANDPENEEYWEPRSYKYKTYFILNHNTGNVKIGRTSGIQTRFKALRTACGDTLELILLIDGDVERQLYELFSYQRVWSNAEWFKFDEAIQEYVRVRKVFQKAKGKRV